LKQTCVFVNYIYCCSNIGKLGNIVPVQVLLVYSVNYVSEWLLINAK